MERNDFIRFWLPFLLLIALNLYAILSLFFYVFRYRKNEIDKKVLEDPRQHSFFLHHLTRKWWIDKSAPFEKFLVRKKIHPNSLTYCSLCLGILAAVMLSQGFFGIGGWFVLFSGALDSLDGRVARSSGRITSRGAFLDSTLDRYSDIFILMGITIFFKDTWVFYLCIFTIMGSVMVSYTRARGQGLGIDCKAGWMQRPERIVYIAISLVLDPIIEKVLTLYGHQTSHYLLIFIIGIVTLLVNVTAIYRVFTIYHSLSDSDKLERHPKAD